MRPSIPHSLVLATLLAGCAVNMGGPRDIPVATVALRAEAGVAPAAAAAALREGGTRTALLVAPGDTAWFRGVAEASSLHLSGPAVTPDGLGLAFLGREPLGDTAIDLSYDGGTFTLQDALYDLDDRRFLDLLAFQVTDPATARPLITALLEYVATDVDATAAVVMAVAVPEEAVGDTVARMLSPGFEDAARCGGGAVGSARAPASAGIPGSAPADGSGIRMFYGPEARIYCRTATVDAVSVGERIRASLVMGRH